MLKLSTSYSKKIKVDERDFTSQGIFAAIEVELPDALQPAEIKERIHAAFVMVKDAVEDEIKGLSNQPAQPVAAAPPPQTADKASNKQVKFITDLGRNFGYSLADLNAQVQNLYHVPSIYDLTKKDASRLVDSLQRNGQRKAA